MCAQDDSLGVPSHLFTTPPLHSLAAQPCLSSDAAGGTVLLSCPSRNYAKSEECNLSIKVQGLTILKPYQLLFSSAAWKAHVLSFKMHCCSLQESS